jgi:hypothetical protein
MSTIAHASTQVIARLLVIEGAAEPAVRIRFGAPAA